MKPATPITNPPATAVLPAAFGAAEVDAAGAPEVVEAEPEDEVGLLFDDEAGAEPDVEDAATMVDVTEAFISTCSFVKLVFRFVMFLHAAGFDVVDPETNITAAH